jgi:sphingomyelin phosphodiesterase 2
VSGELLTVASLNTRGIPLTGSQLAERYAVIGGGFDAGDADVVCCQEVLTYWHLRLLVRRMRSFRRVSYRPGPFGPDGGLVTFSRISS